MPRDTGHRNKPAVPTDGRRVPKVVVPKRKLVEEIPLPPQTLTSDEIEARSGMHKDWMREREKLHAAKPQKERDAIEEEDRVNANDNDKLVGLSDRNLDLSAFDEDPRKTKTHFEIMRACLERI